MKYYVLFFILCAALGITSAQNKTEVRVKHFNADGNLVLEGYDPTSYFTGRPVEGKKIFQYFYQGVTYRFATQDNLDKFKRDPSHYEPAYGGWCAYAMGNDGSKVKVDPETYKIINGRIYLFYNFYFTNTLVRWNENESSLKANAEANWNRIIIK